MSVISRRYTRSSEKRLGMMVQGASDGIVLQSMARLKREKVLTYTVVLRSPSICNVKLALCR